MTLKELEIFVCVSEQGSISAAARLMDITPATASAALKRLEAELGARLFVRSTRSLRLSQEGEGFLGYCYPALDAIADGRAVIAGGGETLRGLLRLSAPSEFGRNLLLPWLDEFQACYPGVRFRLQLSDSLADIYRQPVDVALRYGAPPDSSLVALPLAPEVRRVLCASAAYLKRAGAPTAPEQLKEHNCLCYQLQESLHDHWRFYRNGLEVGVDVRGDRVCDDGDAVRRWAVAGHGIAYKSSLDIVRELNDGRLQLLCDDWLGELTPLNMLCAHRESLTPLVRTLREFLARRCAEALSSLGLPG